MLFVVADLLAGLWLLVHGWRTDRGHRVSVPHRQRPGAGLRARAGRARRRGAPETASWHAARWRRRPTAGVASSASFRKSVSLAACRSPPPSAACAARSTKTASAARPDDCSLDYRRVHGSGKFNGPTGGDVGGELVQRSSGHSNTQRAQRACQHPLHLSSRPPGVGARQRAKHWLAAALRPYLRSSTASSRAYGLDSGHVHRRHRVLPLLERALPPQPRHTVAQRSSTSSSVRVAAARSQ